LSDVLLGKQVAASNQRRCTRIVLGRTLSRLSRCVKISLRACRNCGVLRRLATDLGTKRGATTVMAWNLTWWLGRAVRR